MNLKTSHLTIRNFKPEDRADFFEYRSLPQVCEFQWYDPYTEEKAREFCAKQELTEFPIPWQRKQFAIECDWKVIGDIGLKPESYDVRIVEFGASLNLAFQGKWYAKEALQWVFETLFTDYSVHRIFAITAQENTSCIKLLESLGMRREWDMKQSYWNKGKRHDEFLYAKLKGE